MKRLSALALSAVALLMAQSGDAADPPPLRLEAKIALGDASGRIDHLAIDLRRRRLFVAELGDDRVAVLDLEKGKAVANLTGFAEPQGVGYMPSRDMLYVANGGDGSVRMFQGANLLPAGRIELGEDADNIRVDERGGVVLVGYGRGGLAVINDASHTKVADIPLSAHPEGFALESSGARVFANLPGARGIGVIDRPSRRLSSTWQLAGARDNFPIAIDEAEGLVLTASRNPAKVAAFSMSDGRIATTIDSCGDADDLFVDAGRRRVYVSCGGGFIDVLARRNGEYARIARVGTSAGARTSLWVPELDRLFLAVRRSATQEAAIWVFEPAP
jgi:DNA-binding beta-propeller fold protein YncE